MPLDFYQEMFCKIMIPVYNWDDINKIAFVEKHRIVTTKFSLILTFCINDCIQSGQFLLIFPHNYSLFVVVVCLFFHPLCRLQSPTLTGICQTVPGPHQPLRSSP